MADILGLGTVHSPPLMTPGDALRPPQVMGDPAQPIGLRDTSQWPAQMLEQWSDDDGHSYAVAHRQELIDNVRWLRAELDEFSPDLVVIVGDDQYENFQGDCVPAFQICAYDEFVVRPFADGRANSWDEPPSTVFRFKGEKSLAKQITGELIDAGFDIAYGYKPLHDPLPHAFLNTLLFLDWDRIGWSYPIVPLAINSYGRLLVPLRGRGVNQLAEVPTGDQLDPPSPQPWRCFDLGAALARTLAGMSGRIALIATASWSHAWLSPSTSYFYPDVDADRGFLAALETGDFGFWRDKTTAELERHGQQELLNWTCLLGAMAELDRKASEVHFIASWITNADKGFAVFRP